MLAVTACHMIASTFLLDPQFAERARFCGSSNLQQVFLSCIVQRSGNIVLLTGLFLVPQRSVSKANLSLTFSAAHEW